MSTINSIRKRRPSNCVERNSFIKHNLDLKNKKQKLLSSAVTYIKNKRVFCQDNVSFSAIFNSPSIVHVYLLSYLISVIDSTEFAVPTL